MSITTNERDTARFTVKAVHATKELGRNGHRVTFCGLSERAEIWRGIGDAVTCRHCLAVIERDETLE